MPIIGYSPWQDAANVGSGLANTWGEIAYRIPAIRAQMQQQAMDYELRRQAMEQQNAYQQGMLGVQQGNLDVARQGVNNEQDRIIAERERYAPTVANQQALNNQYASLGNLYGKVREAQRYPGMPPQQYVPDIGPLTNAAPMINASLQQAERMNNLRGLESLSYETLARQGRQAGVNDYQTVGPNSIGQNLVGDLLPGPVVDRGAADPEWHYFSAIMAKARDSSRMLAENGDWIRTADPTLHAQLMADVAAGQRVMGFIMGGFGEKAPPPGQRQRFGPPPPPPPPSGVGTNAPGAGYTIEVLPD